MNRRTTIKLVGGAALGGVAGCLGNADSDRESTPTSTTTEEGWRGDVEFDDVDTELYVEGMTYRFAPGTDEPVVATEGDTVGLAFTSIDNGYNAGHGLQIAAYDVNLKAMENQVKSTTFVADRAGEFEMQCSVYCSDGHHRMKGTLVVE